MTERNDAAICALNADHGLACANGPAEENIRIFGKLLPGCSRFQFSTLFAVGNFGSVSLGSLKDGRTSRRAVQFAGRSISSASPARSSN